MEPKFSTHTKPEVALLFQLWTAGASRKDIAARFGVSESTVYKWMVTYKLPKRKGIENSGHGNPDPTPAEIEERARECRERHYAMRRAEPDECARIKAWRHRA